MTEVGRFEIERVIGRGGNATVWRGRHVSQDVPVAVKVMRPPPGGWEGSRAAFFEEVRSVARLRHPGIVTVLDIGEVPAAAAGELNVPASSPYLVMELVEPGALGLSLVPRDWETARELLLQVLDALAHAHARGVVHRDIKRDNVLISGRLVAGAFEAKLTDFGLARIFSEEEELPAETKRVSGTPRYMAPEQILGKLRRQGPWTDLYSLGCVAWGLVTGHPPFVDENRSELLLSHIRKPLPELRPLFEVPKALVAWLHTMLAKRPEQRYQRAADAAWELRTRVDSSSTEMLGPSRRLDEAVSEVEDTVASDPPFVTGLVEMSDIRPVHATPRRPPVPESWRTARPALSVALSGAGLALFGLRALPLVGRSAECERLWGLLREAIAGGEPQVLALRGAAGSGKSHLARWICERSHEVGAASDLRVTYGAQRSAMDGLEGMLRRYLRGAGLSFEEALAEVTAILTRHRPVDDSIRYDAMTLARMMAPATHGLPEPAERTTAVVNLLAALSEERPVVLWIDDAHRDDDPWRLIAEVFHRRNLPILVVTTVRDHATIPSEVSVLDVGPLSERDHRTLIDELLLLDPDLGDEVAKRTMGNPLFAAQLIGDWVDRGLVVTQDSGFTVSPEHRGTLPGDLVETLYDRLERTVARVADDLDGALTAVIAAAALGRSVARQEWLAVLERLGLAGMAGTEAALLDSGIAVAEEGGFSFAHDLIVEGLHARGAQSARWIDIHRSCSHVLLRATHRNDPDLWGRIARHCEGAGDVDGALEAWRQYIDGVWKRGDYGPSADAVERRAALLESIGAGPDDRRLVETWIHRCLIAGERGDDMEQNLRRLEVAARQGGWGDLIGRAARIRSTWNLMNGRLPDAEQSARDSFEAYRRAGDPDGMLQAEFDLAVALLNQGKSRAAAEHFERVLESLDGSNDVNLLARSLIGVGQVAVKHHENEKARRYLERALAIGEEIGSRQRLAMASMFLGDLERDEGKLDLADRHFANAQAIWRSAGNASSWISALKRIWLGFERGSFNYVRDLETIRHELDTNGRQYGVRYATLGIAVCAARAGDFGRWEVEFESARWMIDESGDAHHDLIFLAQQNAAACAAAGDGVRAARASELVEELKRRAGGSG